MENSHAPSVHQHSWRFFRAGGVDQVRFEVGDDLVHLDQLDQKLWMALSCPVRGLEFDERTLGLIDGDGDGRVRAPEILAAVQWAASLLKDPSDLLKEGKELPLAAIQDVAAEGGQLLASAQQILLNLGKADSASITVEDTTDPRVFGQTKFNGDGIITVESSSDEETRRVIADILSTHGGEMDRSGVPGINRSRVDVFFEDAQAFSDWHQKAETDPAAILPLGDGTAPAHAALKAVQDKVDDYFARCRLAAFDPRAVPALNRQESEYHQLAANDLTFAASEVAGFPLARVEAGKSLPLRAGLNPGWAAAMEVFFERAVVPILGEDTLALSEPDWAVLTGKFAAYETWLNSKTGAAVEKLGVARVRKIMASPVRDTLDRLIAEDRKLEPEAAAIGQLERLTRYYRDLRRLLVNFVSFEDFYSGRRKAIFQAGTLYLDRRSCDLCIRVDDPSKHALLAILSKSYLAYCHCTRPGSGEKMTIAAAFTDGDSDYLMAGRNGLFYDRKGRDWDATIIKVIDNPISIRQAFWAPYKRLIRAIEEMVAKRAGAADSAAEKRLAAATVAADKTKPAESRKLDVGTVAAIGIAAGFLVAALGVLLQAFWGLGVWMPLGIAGLIVLISGPSMAIAWLKLRQRSLGPILDANGWAINGRVKVNVPFGKALTKVATLPLSSHRSLIDPYADTKSGWVYILVLIALLSLAGWFLNQRGHLHDWFGIGKEVQKEPPAEVQGQSPTHEPPAGTNSPAS